MTSPPSHGIVRSQMTSRQERRKAERDAAKRAPAKAGAAGAAGAAAALENLNVNPLGDWKTQAEDPAVGLADCSPILECRKTRVAVNYVASDICLARPLGAV